MDERALSIYYIISGYKCVTPNPIAAGAGSTTFNITGMLTAATSRNVAAYYAVETTGSNYQPQCTEG